MSSIEMDHTEDDHSAAEARTVDGPDALAKLADPSFLAALAIFRTEISTTIKAHVEAAISRSRPASLAGSRPVSPTFDVGRSHDDRYMEDVRSGEVSEQTIPEFVDQNVIDIEAHFEKASYPFPSLDNVKLSLLKTQIQSRRLALKKALRKTNSDSDWWDLLEMCNDDIEDMVCTYIQEDIKMQDRAKTMETDLVTTEKRVPFEGGGARKGGRGPAPPSAGGARKGGRGRGPAPPPAGGAAGDGHSGGGYGGPPGGGYGGPPGGGYGGPPGGGYGGPPGGGYGGPRRGGYGGPPGGGYGGPLLQAGGGYGPCHFDQRCKNKSCIYDHTFRQYNERTKSWYWE
jgi:hypothetical protein